MDIDQQIAQIVRGIAEIIHLEGLRGKLAKSIKTKKVLVIKAGFDPTAPDIHLGHVVLLRKLRQFQDFGHTVQFLIGNFTAIVGDPTGRDQSRPQITEKDIAENAKSYKLQFFKILDPKKTKVVFNADWLKKLSSQDILGLTAHSSVAQMLARADFKRRMEANNEIRILEFIYPLLQGYDSVHLKADVELGGTDQKFNLLMGRQIQEAYGQEPQVVIMTPLLEGTDGVKKMSKTLGNYIGINETPKEIFGKVMSISDDLMMKYYEFLTDSKLVDVRQEHPKEAKLKLAGILVGQFHGASAAKTAREEFEKTFSHRQSPEDVLEYRLKDTETLADVLLSQGLVASKNEFRRLLKEGAISCDGKKIVEESARPNRGTIKVGKRRFLKLT